LDEPHHRERVDRALGILSALIAPSADSPGLELGAGSGKIAQRIRGMGYPVVVSDASENALSLAAKRGLEVLQFDASLSFPLPDGKFRFVFAGELIEHLFDTRRFLSECRRVLAPGGALILTTPNLATLNDRLIFLVGHSPRQVSALHEYLHLHIRPFTATSLRYTLEQCGFHDIRIYSHMLEFGGGDFCIRSKRLGRMFPSLGKSLIASARLRDETVS
jgi:SAM-dependent methyltransferase